MIAIASSRLNDLLEFKEVLDDQTTQARSAFDALVAIGHWLEGEIHLEKTRTHNPPVRDRYQDLDLDDTTIL